MIDKKLFGRALAKAWKTWNDGAESQNFVLLCQFFSLFMQASEGRGQEYRNAIHRFLHQDLCLREKHLQAFWLYVDQGELEEQSFSKTLTALMKNEQIKPLLPFVYYLSSLPELSVGEKVLFLELGQYQLALQGSIQGQISDLRRDVHGLYNLLDIAPNASDEELEDVLAASTTFSFVRISELKQPNFSYFILGGIALFLFGLFIFLGRRKK